MRIRMARPAVGVGHIPELLELLAVAGGHLVALFAIDLHVPTAQGEIGLGVVELLHWFPSRHIMTATAILGHAPLVEVGVA